MEPCLRCGTFVPGKGRTVPDLAFCQPCVDVTVPQVMVSRDAPPRGVRVIGLQALAASFVPAAAGFGVAVAMGAHRVSAFVGALFAVVLGRWFLLVRARPHREGEWRRALLEQHGFGPLACEAPAVVSLLRGNHDAPETGLLFAGEEGFAFFGRRGTRSAVNFAEISGVESARALFFIPLVHLRREAGSFVVFPFDRGARGRAWVDHFAEHALRGGAGQPR